MSWASRYERQGALRTGSTRQPVSGGLWTHKADYKNDIYLTEQKTTRARLFVVTPAIWNTVLQQAKIIKLRPRLVICFVPAPGLESWWSITGMQQIAQRFTLHNEYNERRILGLRVRQLEE